MKKVILTFGAIIVLFFILMSFFGEEQDVSNSQKNGLLYKTQRNENLKLSDRVKTTEDLPLLPAGNHLGIFATFEKLPGRAEEIKKEEWNKALSQGMSVGRVHLDWAELEPKPGKYDRDALKGALELCNSDGLHSFVGIFTIDSEGLTLPSHLLDPHSKTGLVNDANFDDPEIVGKFNKLLDWAVPMIVSYNGCVISLMNEPQAYFNEYPRARKRAVSFFEAVRNHIHSINSNLAVTVTLTQEAIGVSYGDNLIAASDVVTFNYYPLNKKLILMDDISLPAIRKNIRKMLKAANGKQLIIQELGIPSGYEKEKSGVNGTTMKQRQFLQNSYAIMEEEPRLRIIFVFLMFDWSRKTIDLFTDALDQDVESGEISKDFVENYREWMGTCGLIRFDGLIKPAWNDFLRALEKFRKKRE